jgi:hypothetical protein
MKTKKIDKKLVLNKRTNFNRPGLPAPWTPSKAFDYRSTKGFDY